MFYGCTSLINTPDLPATTLDSYSCESMFAYCKALTKVPKVLYPTTVKNNSYSSMFKYCIKLTTIPVLNATTVYSFGCYSMFYGCESLVEPPEGWILKAKTTDTYSCNSMFSGCSKLQKMAVSYSGTINSSHWSSFLSSVSKTGTFYYSKNQTKENIKSIVPSGWTLVQSTAW